MEEQRQLRIEQLGRGYKPSKQQHWKVKQGSYGEMNLIEQVSDFKKGYKRKGQQHIKPFNKNYKKMNMFDPYVSI